MDNAKIEITRKDLPTYILTITGFDLDEFVYTLSNSEEFPHSVKSYPHTNTLTIKPRYSKESITVTYGDTIVWNNVPIGVISVSELIKIMSVKDE